MKKKSERVYTLITSSLTTIILTIALNLNQPRLNNKDNFIGCCYVRNNGKPNYIAI